MSGSPGSTATPSRVAGIDTLRASAALAVFFCHVVQFWELGPRLPSKVPQVFALGAHGVDLFIVISGFCLALPVAARRLDLAVAPYAIRRAFRILPAYYVALGLAAVLAMNPSTYHWIVAGPASWRDLGLHVLSLQTWTPAVGTINGSLWSVALEVHLYVLFPLVVLLWRRVDLRWILLGCALLSVVWTALGPGVVGDLYVVPPRLVQFVLGMWCAERLVAGAVPRPRVLAGILVLSGLLAVALSTADVRVGICVAWAVPCGAAVLLVASRYTDALRGSPSDRFGATTFSFYLLHQPVLLVGYTVVAGLTTSPGAQLAIACTIVLGVTIGLATLLHRAVELPSQALGYRFSRRASKQTRSVPVPP